MKLILGLGNHPKEYEKTRHNIGFRFLEHLAKQYEFPPFRTEKKFFASVSTGQIGAEKCILLKPETYMNLSGKSLGMIFQFYRIKTEDMCVISDDIDLPFGTVRFRESGQSGGHNGLNSIITVLGTKNFARIKFGISNEMRAKVPAEKFVLQKFSPAEEKEIPPLLHQGEKLLLEKIF